jgi:hypothetical protein
MTDADNLMVDNFVEALKQVQQYAVLGLGTSGSALALSLKAVAVGTQSGFVIPGFSVAIDPGAARAVLLVVCVLVGAMAYYCADTANGIAACLKEKPELVFAASTFPCNCHIALPNRALRGSCSAAGSLPRCSVGSNVASTSVLVVGILGMVHFSVLCLWFASPGTSQAGWGNLACPKFRLGMRTDGAPGNIFP